MTATPTAVVVLALFGTSFLRAGGHQRGPAAPLCARLFRATQSAAAASPERPGARRSTALHGAGWCWTGAAGWGGERAGMPWSEGSSGSRPHGWPDGRVRIRRSVGGCCGPGVPWGKDCLLPERLWTQW